MAKKKAKGRGKAPSLTAVLKKIYLEKLTNKLSDEAFITQVRDVVITASNKAEVSEDEVRLLKFIAQNYITLFINGKVIKSQDVKTLAAFTFERWLNEADMLKVNTLITEGRSKALKLEAGTKKECEAIIISIGESFAVQGVTKQIQFDYLIELIQGRFLTAAKLEFNKLSRGQCAPIELEELLVRVFTNTFELQDMSYLANVVDIFKINLKSFTVQSKSGEVVSALTFFLALPTPN